MKTDKKHTDKTYDAELDELRQKLLTLGGKVESEIHDGVRALIERDSILAESVMRADREVNRLEVEIDEMCRRILALRQPAASDLRLITTALKVVVDLERIGDLAVNIAERSIDLNQSAPLTPVPELPHLAQLCKDQVHAALECFVESNPEKAEAVIKADELIDAVYHQLFHGLVDLMLEDSKNIRRVTSLMFIAKHLERLADHATNVAEMVIFMVRGTDIRHPGSREP